MKRFGLIGVAGYVAPRHLKAISETGNDLVVAMDTSDSVGILDGYFPRAEFFTDFETFEAFVEDEKLAGRVLDCISICSPNYLHLPHIKLALRNGIDVICEKPLVLNAKDLGVVQNYELAYGAKVNSILQLRLHPSILKLRERVLSAPLGKIFDVDLTYMTSRGLWYMRSWKGLDNKSGGVATNIGVHFFDMLHFIFGPVVANEVHYRDAFTNAGFLEFSKARVRWFLSIDAKNLPDNAIQGEKLTYRSITIEGEELEFSDGFVDLHTESYRRILRGDGYGVDENRMAIETVEQIRMLDVVRQVENQHPLLAKLR